MFWDIFVSLCNDRQTKPNTVARELGLSTAACTHWKQRGTIPNGDTLQKIAGYFGVTVDYLLGKEKSRTYDGTADEYANIRHLLNLLSEEQKEQALRMMEAMLKEMQ